MCSLLVEKGVDMAVSKHPTRVNKGSGKEGGEMNYLSGEVLNDGGGGGGSAEGGGGTDDADGGSYRLTGLLTLPSDALERGRRRRWKRRRYGGSDDEDDGGGFLRAVAGKRASLLELLT